MADSKKSVNSLAVIGIGGIVAFAFVMAAGHMNRAALAAATPPAAAQYDPNATHYRSALDARAACGAQGFSEVQSAGIAASPSVTYVCGRYSVHSTAGDGALVVERAG